MMSSFTQTIQWGGRPLSLEIGRVAKFANCAVLARYGETVVLATVVSSKPREDLGYFPLTVDYEERLYAGGRIRSSRFVKREGKPSDEAILSDRRIDRSIRPLFPKNYWNETQVIITVLSVDLENDPDILSLLATAVALQLSDIPWNGPVVGCRVGMQNGGFLLNPRSEERKYSDLDLVLTLSRDAVVMLEADGREVAEEKVVEAIAFARENVAPVFDLIEEAGKAVGREKQKIKTEEIEAKLKKEVVTFIEKGLKEELWGAEAALRDEISEAFREKVFIKFEGKLSKNTLSGLIEEVTRNKIREKILTDGERVDGRKGDEIRPLSMEVALLPRTHGSALFQRGDTQVLTIATLGSTSLEQLIERMTGEETKRFMHHYNFPPFSTGETGRMGGPGRREIGHGALAERSLESVIPSETEFPYAIRLVSEVLSSSGSTSMASICAASLALMDAGVNIKRPVGGVAMGLVSDKKKAVVLTDLGALEDFYGDMDFKIAGTEQGITGLQLDVKINYLSEEIVKTALFAARQARLEILQKMSEVIKVPRSQLSVYAPRITVIKIDPKKIGGVIGGGGKNIRAIIEATGTAIDIKDDGTVYVSSSDEAAIKKAVEWIERMVKEAVVGETYEGTVKRVTDFGAFVEILPGKEGLVHISELSWSHVVRVTDIVKLGDKIKVKVVGIDELGRINLSKKALETPPPGGADRERFAPRRPSPFGLGGRSRGGPPRRPPYRPFPSASFQRQPYN